MIGIIVGQIFVGLIGDGIGRRFGLIQDAVVMFVALLMLTAAWEYYFFKRMGYLLCLVLILLFYWCRW